MIDTDHLNQLADKLSAVIPQNVKTLKADIDKNIKAILETSLQNMNLVSREEFDVQSALLARTQAKLKQLEQQVEALEKNT